MTSFRTLEEKALFDKTVNYLNRIVNALDITFNVETMSSSVTLTGDPTDFAVLSERLLLISKFSYYLSIMQGDALTLQKQYKTPELYGLYEKISELNRTVRTETDSLRSILSTAKEQIKMK